MATVQITDHAVERFVERHAREMTLSEARTYLETHVCQAVPVKERTILGQTQWVLPDPKCVLVIKHDPKLRAPVCVTILPNVEGVVVDDLDLHEEDLPFPALLEREQEKALAAIKKVASTIPKVPETIDLTVASRGTVKARPLPSMPRHTPINDILALQRVVAKKEAERTKRHMAKTNDQVEKQKTIIRASLRYLLGRAAEQDKQAMAILEAIQLIEPGMVTTAFVGQKKPKSAA